jgi:hypothetical protein
MGPASPPLVLPDVLPLVLPDVLPLVLPELLPLVLPDVLPELLPLPEPLLPPLPPSPKFVVLLEHPPANEANGTATKATTLKAGLNLTEFLLGNDPLFESPRANRPPYQPRASEVNANAVLYAAYQWCSALRRNASFARRAARGARRAARPAARCNQPAWADRSNPIQT